MEKIPTAEEFFSKDNGLYTAYNVKDRIGNFQPVCSYEKAIEFAKLHVEAALKAAIEKAKTKEDIAIFAEGSYRTQVVDKNSILNCYPLENIK